MGVSLSAEETSNVSCVCKAHYIAPLIKELSQMAINADPVVPVETSAPNAEVPTPRGRAVPVERPSSRCSTRKPYEVRLCPFLYIATSYL